MVEGVGVREGEVVEESVQDLEAVLLVEGVVDGVPLEEGVPEAVGVAERDEPPDAV